MAPRRRARATPLVQRGVVKLARNSRYRLEEPVHPPPRWARDSTGRLVSNLPRRPNIGGYGDLEVFYHVGRVSPDEVLPPPRTLWRQRYGDQHTISYRPLWVNIAKNLSSPLRKRSDASLGSQRGDMEGAVGVPYLYTYDEDAEPDEDGEPYRRWRPLKILANGGYGVVITYVDDAQGFTGVSEIADEDIIVAKFNYKGGDLVDIMASVVNQITMTERLRQAQEAAARAAKPEPTPAPRAAEKRVRKEEILRQGEMKKRKRSSSSSWGSARWSSSDKSSSYSHYQTPSAGLDVNTTETFRQETQILEILDMTGSPHFPKFWKLADPPQDGTLCTMDYIPDGKTLAEQLNTRANEKIPIRLIWEAVLCLSKAMSAMAYGSEDPAPSHRVHGWNQIVHLDWSEANIFVRQNCASHTCSHSPCFVVGDFGFALIVPNRPKTRKEFRKGHLNLDWHKNLNPRLPEADIDKAKPFEERVEHPIIGHFSHKTNVFLMAEVWRDNLGGNQIGKIGVMRYMQDNLTLVEHAQLAQDLQSHLPEDERLGEPLIDSDDSSSDDSSSDDSSSDDSSSDDSSSDESDSKESSSSSNDSEDAENYAPRVRGYVDVAESLLAQNVAQDLRVSEQRFVNLMLRCLSHDPADRPEIEEIMLQAARGMAEAGVFDPSSDSEDSE